MDTQETAATPVATKETLPADAMPLDERLRRYEAEIIAAALAETGGNKSKAARRLGIKRSTLGDRIDRCGLRSHDGRA